MNIPDQQLSEHFRLIDLVRSQTADRLGIDNDPSPEIIERLRVNAANMEVVQEELGGNPIHVSSGYRCLILNRALKSKDTSAHVDGRATDFECPEYGSPLEICQNLAATDMQFDQLIWEHTWVHIAWARAGETPRRQVLTLMPGGRYAIGIVEH